MKLDFRTAELKYLNSSICSRTIRREKKKQKKAKKEKNFVYFSGYEKKPEKCRHHPRTKKWQKVFCATFAYFTQCLFLLILIPICIKKETAL